MTDKPTTTEAKDQISTDDNAAAVMLRQAIAAARATQTEYQWRIDQLDSEQADRRKSWLREAALRIIETETIPESHLGRMDLASAAVDMARELWTLVERRFEVERAETEAKS